MKKTLSYLPQRPSKRPRSNHLRRKSSGSALGTTVISLGDPNIGGMWLKTPLVKAERAGQVRYRGVVVAVTLQPLDAEPGSGSQISVRAMQALGASLSELVEVSVEAI